MNHDNKWKVQSMLQVKDSLLQDFRTGFRNTDLFWRYSDKMYSEKNKMRGGGKKLYRIPNADLQVTILQGDEF